MITDAVFYGQYFFIELTEYSSGTIKSPIEWSGNSEAFALRLALPERISIS